MTLAAELLPAAKAHARIDTDDEDAALLLMIEAALGDVLAAANVTLPEDGTLPADLVFAVIDVAAMLYDARGGATERDRPRGLTMAATTICARYRGVSLGALE